MKIFKILQVLFCFFLFNNFFVSLHAGCSPAAHSYHGHHVLPSSNQCASDGLGVCAAMDVPHGGTGKCSLTAYAVLCGGTTSTSVVQTTGPGTAGYVLTSNGASALPTFQSASTTIVTTITATGAGSHTLNAATKFLTVIGYGGGGGGGSGRQATSTTSGGGSGGGSGSSFMYNLPASFFGGGGASVSYSVGNGGAGGAAQATASSNGVAGSAGAATSFGNLTTSTVTSNAGAGGTNGAATAGASNVALGNVSSVTEGTPGGAGSLTAGATPTALSSGISAPTGGGGGAGAESGVSYAGGTGGAIVHPGSGVTLLAGGAAGGGSGNPNTSLTNCIYGGTGGGGGSTSSGTPT